VAYIPYSIEVFAEWRGKAFYLNVRYRARSRKVEDDFVVRHTRMTLTSFGRFDLAYFRHTDKWFTVYLDTRMLDELLSLSFVAIALSLSECVQLLSL
jgi:hypothetical protein